MSRVTTTLVTCKVSTSPGYTLVRASVLDMELNGGPFLGLHVYSFVVLQPYLFSYWLLKSKNMYALFPITFGGIIIYRFSIDGPRKCYNNIAQERILYQNVLSLSGIMTLGIWFILSMHDQGQTYSTL